MRIRKSTLEKVTTYGELYSHLCETVGEIPIAIYRSEQAIIPGFDPSDIKEVSKHKNFYIKVLDEILEVIFAVSTLIHTKVNIKYIIY